MIEPFKPEHRARCYEIFNELDGWFGSEEINSDYAKQLSEKSAFVALVNGRVEGVISIEWHFGTTAEIYSMATSLALHRKGIGKRLMLAAEKLARDKSYEFLHVKTLGDEVPHPGYKNTREFYENYGFKRLFQTKDLWDGLPTMLYVKIIK
ncbi:GNAT family N-acetyltransferase [Reinekea sp.]|jgi:GNAT superfamily N-acetyltransferase|uniref:GNAT family N-acetyltransferase n=1 Tax=Reinekea sp. TaxID=1970455 RepID=UPI0039894E85